MCGSNVQCGRRCGVEARSLVKDGIKISCHGPTGREPVGSCLAKGNYWVHFRCAACWEIAGQGGHCKEKQRHDQKHSRIMVCWFSPKWEREGALRKFRFRPSGGNFRGMGSFDPMEVLGAQERVFVSPSIVSMSPPGYPSAWLRPRIASFRLTRQDHGSSAAPCCSQFPVCH